MNHIESRPLLRQRGRTAVERWNRYFAAMAIQLSDKLLRRGLHERARSLLKSFITFAPRVLALRLRLAKIALIRCDFAEARSALIRADISNIPGIELHWRRLANLMIELEQFDDAVDYLTAAERKSPDSYRLWILWGKLHYFTHKIDLAVDCYNRAAERSLSKRARVIALECAANSLADSGRAEAEEYYRLILTIDPQHAFSYFGIIESNKNLSNNDPIIETAKKLVTSIRTNDRQHLHYALATVHDRNAEYGSAFCHLMLANQIRRRVVGAEYEFEIRDFISEIDARCRVFTKERISELSKSGIKEDFLICVVGMPRSGTTLVEQILGSYSQVRAIGERNDVRNLTFNLQRDLKSKQKYPDCCDQLKHADVERLSLEIRNHYELIAGQQGVIVTKLPEDYLDLGLIAILFPKVRIVHCVRNPLDTCLSCFSSNFNAIPYAADLDELVVVYQSYQKIMNHWRRVLPAGSIFDLSYETIVADPVAVARELCAFCGIEFTDECLDFHTRSTRVRTMSRWQVRQPIYKTSAGRSRRYREFLGPLSALVNNSEGEGADPAAATEKADVQQGRSLIASEQDLS